MCDISPDYVIRSHSHHGRRLLDVLNTNYSINENGCFIWSGYKNSSGYGVIRLNGRLHRVTRLVYQFTHRKKPDERDVVRHKCDNPACVNPAHLEIGSRNDNVQDMISRGRNLSGEKCPWAKFSRAQADEIRRRRSIGERSVDLAREFGVHPNTIYAIFAEKSYV